MTAHHLDDRAALMALHRVAELVDALDGGVAGGIKADGIVRAAHVVVDRRGNADHRNAHARELQRAAERAVAADGDDRVDAEQLAHRDSLFASLDRHELVTARRIQDRAALREDMADVDALELHKIAGDQAVIAATDADALDAEVLSRAHDGADSRVHAGSVAAAGEYADSFHCRCHMYHSFIYDSFPYGSRQPVPQSR